MGTAAAKTSLYLPNLTAGDLQAEDSPTLTGMAKIPEDDSPSPTRKTRIPEEDSPPYQNTRGKTRLKAGSPRGDGRASKRFKALKPIQMQEETKEKISSLCDNGEGKGDSQDQEKAARLHGSPSIHDFDFLALIGRGGQGKIFLSRVTQKSKFTSRGNVFVLKRVPKGLDKKSQHAMRDALQERRVMAPLKHPFVAELQASFQTNQALYFALPFYQQGDLHELCLDGKALPKSKIVFYMSEVVEAVCYLHGWGIAHRDIKPENVALTAGGHVKLLDFGLAFQPVNEEDSTAHGKVGTKKFMAPEVAMGGNYTSRCDWWSVGKLCHFLAGGDFADVDEDDNACYVELSDRDTEDFVNDLIVEDPENRLCMRNVRKHAFFSGVKWASVINHQASPAYYTNAKSETDVTFFSEAQEAEDIDEDIQAMKRERDQPDEGEEQSFRGFNYVNPDLQ